MDCELFISNHFGSHELEGNEMSPDIAGGESPPSSTTGLFGDHKTTTTTTTSSKRSRCSIQKRVVSIPIKDIEGSRPKGEGAPPSDSWAWRKYGQKPIKGSPYPRGYYRCSSSKGCPARKQVERSRLDPTMLVVTYSYEHNHPGPVSRNNHQSNENNLTVSVSVAIETPALKKAKSTTTFAEPDPDEKFGDLSGESLTIGDEFGWFGDMASTSSSTILESPILVTETNYNIGAEMTMFFPMVKEEDESLFADLGELPDCSKVFRLGLLENDEGQQCTSSPWCRTT